MVVEILGIMKNGNDPDDGTPPLEPSVQPISWPIGAAGYVRVEVFDPTEELVNIAGMAVTLCVRKKTSDATPIIKRIGIVTNPVNWIAVFPLSPDDTAALAQDIYRYDIWLTDFAGLTYQLVPASNFSLSEVELRSGELPGPATPVLAPTNGAVDTVNTTGKTLASIDVSQVTDGFTLWVREPGQGFWHLEIGKAYPIDAKHIAAVGQTGAQWVSGLGIGASALERVDFDGGAGSLTPGEDVFPDEREVDFDHLDPSLTSLLCVLLATARVTGGTGTFRVRVGGTAGMPDGIVVAQGTRMSTTYGQVEFTAAAFARPVGAQRVKVTMQNDTVGETSYVKSAAAEFRAA